VKRVYRRLFLLESETRVLFFVDSVKRIQGRFRICIFFCSSRRILEREGR
jgi:hypothetical protein